MPRKTKIDALTKRQRQRAGRKLESARAKNANSKARLQP